MMLAASIVTLLVFTADEGRYVPTGSVLGFQGPSYYYITGFWGVIISVCWGISTTAKLKRLEIFAREDGAMLVREQVIGRSREMAIPAGDLKAILIKQHPSSGHVAWLVIAFGWFAFILQFAIPNLQLPFAEFPAAGTALLVFDGCMVGTAVIGVWRPGIHIVLIDAAARHVIKMPGVTSAAALASKMTLALESAFKLHPIVASRSAFDLNANAWFRTVLFGAVVFLIIGVVNVVLLLAGSHSSYINPGSAWVMVTEGCLGMIAFGNRGNALPLHLRVAFQTSVSWTGIRSAPRLWLVVIGVIGCLISWYFVGLHVRFGTTGLDGNANKILSLGVISFLYTSWCIYTSTGTAHSVLVNLGDVYSASISSFSLKILSLRRTHHPLKFNKSLETVAMIILFGDAALVTFVAGYVV